jgi:hypothetical protein
MNKKTKVENKYCKVCSEVIHPLRVKMGYSTTCVKHSTAERYTGFVVADHKTADSIQIIKDPEVGKKLVELSNIYNH